MGIKDLNLFGTLMVLAQLRVFSFFSLGLLVVHFSRIGNGAADHLQLVSPVTFALLINTNLIADACRIFMVNCEHIYQTTYNGTNITCSSSYMAY